MRLRTVAAAAAAAALLAACSTTTTASRPAAVAPGTDRGNVEATAPGPATQVACGVERWPVKTGTDPGAALVDLGTVVPATIAQLRGTTAPALPLPQASRVTPVEVTVYQVTATLVKYKLEADNDVHMVLADAQGNTMVAEIPAPPCATGSRFGVQIAAARNTFTARYIPDSTWHPAGVPVTVTGVGFFDPEHGQTGGGVLAGGQVTIELHPVLGLVFGGGSPSPAPSTTAVP